MIARSAPNVGRGRLGVSCCGLTLLLGAVIALAACSASTARAAEGIVPVEGSWVATTSAGLPVSFEVKEGSVRNAHFRFKWGFCGTYESHLSNTDPIDSAGHWSFVDARGQTIEGTFVAPDRVEGTVEALERELPGCPHTRATFVAMPGEAPPFVKPQTFAVQNTNSGHLARRPREIVLARHGSFRFYDLSWQSFGGHVAHATGRAYIRRGKRVWRPQAAVRLSFEIEDGPDKRIYATVRWVLRGPVPPGFARRSFKIVA